MNPSAPPKLTRDEVEALIEGPASSRLATVALSVAIHADDLLWAEEVCCRLAANGDAQVRGNALTGFAHLARRFHDLSYIAIALVQAGEQDPDPFVKQQAAAALAELKRSLRPQR